MLLFFSMDRKSDFPIQPLILNRRSLRAMSGEELSDPELMALFEAARWAPSSYNSQPWRFIYAKRNTEAFDRFFNLLVEFNQGWTKTAAALVIVISKKTFEQNGQPSTTHRFDSGAAWENLALEATTRGLVAHGMEGFDYAKARQVLEIPDDFDIEAMLAIGKKGKKEDLPPALQEREAPSDRKPLADIIMEGKFRG
jgi:nitroreductase